MSKLSLGSLFDGSGGFPLGGMLCGIEPLWASEIEPFPIRVTTKRIPQMKHYGDISKLNGAELPPVGIITFGSPCTDMSVAGKRTGLDGSQSVLFYEAIRIIKEMRCKTDGRYPRYAVWENVPGAFSSNKGADFKAVLEAVISVTGQDAEVPAPVSGRWPYADLYMGNGWSVAYRTVDAQYFGVPQRRRRIYLVADFTGECAGEILFEPEGVSRNFAPSGSPWKGTARDAENGTGAAGNSVTCLNDQGGSRMEVTKDTTATLRAEAHHPPCVMEAAGFCTEHSAKARSIGYEEEKSPTLRAGVVPAAVFENHSQDTRYRGPLDKAQPVSATYGMGGNNQPFVVETPKTLKIRSGCEGGGKGALVQDDMSATLGCNNDQTVFVPTAYGICSDASNSMKSDNPHSGIYEADTSRTLDANGGNPGCNQGGIAVVALQGSMIGREDKNGPQGSGVDEDVSFTLNTVDRHAVAYAMTTGNFTQVEKELSPTLMARDFKDPNAVAQPASFYPQMKAESQCFRQDGTANTLVNGTNPGYQNGLVEPTYIVRRLTPTECARLQGFPDDWCDDLGTENPTEEDIAFWTEVWETHRRTMGTSDKTKSRKQIIKWLQHPHSDAAEYKMWGNGVALPCVCFVLSGIVSMNP